MIGVNTPQKTRLQFNLTPSKYLSDELDLSVIPSPLNLIARTGVGKNTAVWDQFPNVVIIEPTRLKCQQEVDDHPGCYYAFDGNCTVPDGCTSGQIVTTPESFFHVVRKKITPKHFTVVMDEKHLLSLANYRQHSMTDTFTYLQGEWGGVILMSGTDAPLVGEFFKEFTTVEVASLKRKQQAQCVFYDSGQRPHVIAELVNRVKADVGNDFCIVVKLNNKEPAGAMAAIQHDCGLAESQIVLVNADTLHNSASQSLIDGHWPDGVNVIFATDVFETGLNVYDNADAVIFANAPGSQSAEQTVNRFRRNAPKAYILFGDPNRAGNDTTFDPEKHARNHYDMAKSLVQTLNTYSQTKDLTDPLVKQAHICASQLRQTVMINEDDTGREFYAVDDITISQQIAAEIQNQERHHPEFFKRRMVALYGWGFDDDLIMPAVSNSAVIEAVTKAKEEVKQQRETDLERHCVELETIGPVRAKEAYKAKNGEPFFLQLANIALMLHALIGGDWKTAVALTRFTKGKDGRFRKLKQQLKGQQLRANGDYYTQMIYSMFSVGDKYELKDYRRALFRIFNRDPRLRAYIFVLKRLVRNQDIAEFLGRYFELKRRQKRINGKVISLYEIVDDSPRVDGQRLYDIVLSQQNPFGTSP